MFWRYSIYYSCSNDVNSKLTCLNVFLTLDATDAGFILPSLFSSVLRAIVIKITCILLYVYRYNKNFKQIMRNCLYFLAFSFSFRKKYFRRMALSFSFRKKIFQKNVCSLSHSASYVVIPSQKAFSTVWILYPRARPW